MDEQYATILDANLPTAGRYHICALISHDLATARAKVFWHGQESLRVVTTWELETLEAIALTYVPDGTEYPATICRLARI